MVYVASIENSKVGKIKKMEGHNTVEWRRNRIEKTGYRLFVIWDEFKEC